VTHKIRYDPTSNFTTYFNKYGEMDEMKRQSVREFISLPATSKTNTEGKGLHQLIRKKTQKNFGRPSNEHISSAVEVFSFSSS
jgi:hypothetical protein